MVLADYKMRLASTGWVNAELKLFLSTLTSAYFRGLAVTAGG